MPRPDPIIPDAFDSGFITHYYRGFCARAYLAQLNAEIAREEGSSIYEIANYATDSVIYACMFLEAGLNSVFDYYIHPRSSSENVEDYVRILRRLNKIKGGNFFDGLNVFDKAEVLLGFLDKSSSKGDKVSEDVKLLIQLRNALIHSRSEGEIYLNSGEASSFGKLKLLEPKLKDRFEFNNFPSGATSSMPAMLKIFSSECAGWAVASASNYWNFIANEINPSGNFHHPCIIYEPAEEYEKYSPKKKKIRYTE